MALQIKISLRGVRPPIWRRVLVPSNFTLHDLHLIIQAAMGWSNYHLYEFSFRGQRFSLPDEDRKSISVDSVFEQGGEIADSRRTRLRDLGIKNTKTMLLYLYDFGDNWEHDVVVEKTIKDESGKDYPQCIAGGRAPPLEDCGSIPGYYELVEAFAHPEDKKHKELRKWAGGKYDPEYFDLDGTNRDVKDYKDMEGKD